MYTNRYVCSVLDEMRKSLSAVDPRFIDTYTFLKLKSLQRLLIEEAQTMVNRMEEALEDVSDIKRMKLERKELHAEVKALKKEKREIKVALKGEDEAAKDSVKDLQALQERFNDDNFLRIFNEDLDDD